MSKLFYLRVTEEDCEIKTRTCSSRETLIAIAQELRSAFDIGSVVGSRDEREIANASKVSPWKPGDRTMIEWEARMIKASVDHAKQLQAEKEYGWTRDWRYFYRPATNQYAAYFDHPAYEDYRKEQQEGDEEISYRRFAKVLLVNGNGRWKDVWECHICQKRAGTHWTRGYSDSLREWACDHCD